MDWEICGYSLQSVRMDKYALFINWGHGLKKKSSCWALYNAVKQTYLPNTICGFPSIVFKSNSAFCYCSIVNYLAQVMTTNKYILSPSLFHLVISHSKHLPVLTFFFAVTPWHFWPISSLRVLILLYFAIMWFAWIFFPVLNQIEHCNNLVPDLDQSKWISDLLSVKIIWHLKHSLTTV